MRKILAALGGAAFGSLLLVATVAAADPTPRPSPASASVGTVARIIGLSQVQIHDLRQDGLSLAQIASQHGIDVQKIVDAMVAQWKERIEARVTNGALTAAEAAQLQAKLNAEAQALVNKTTLGGMQGAAVGAGPGSVAGNGAGNGDNTRARDGSGTGTGTCDGAGPHGPGQP